MEDFRAPSFSLGFDLDFDSNPQSPPQHNHTQPQQIPIELSSQSTESDEEIQVEKLHHQAQVEDPPPPLKRLRRGPPKHIPVDEKKGKPVLVSSNLDEDEIEDFSSPEDSFRGGHSAEPKHSVCSSSKFVFNGHKVLNAKIVNKQKTCSGTPPTESSITSKLEAMENKQMFPKLTVSPLRRFQLLDSDSDDPSVAEDEHDKPDKVNAFEKRCKPTQSMMGHQEKRSKQAPNTVPNQDLWKDFSPVKNMNMRIPATNRFYKENVMPEKGKNVVHNNEGHISFSFSRGNTQKDNFQTDLSNPLAPCYNYFYHDDMRIQNLVRERLPNFSPLSAVDCRENFHADATVDYMSQFGQRGKSTQPHGIGSNNLKGYSNMGKNTRSSYSQGATIASGDWVNTQGCPNDAGKRRVRADCGSAGQWYTSQDGTRVYVSKSGQTMTGQTAYRQYRKERGVGFKRSSKKATTKKK